MHLRRKKLGQSTARVAYLVHYDTCDLSGPLLHDMKLSPERSEDDNSRRAVGHLNHKYRILFYSTLT